MHRDLEQYKNTSTLSLNESTFLKKEIRLDWISLRNNFDKLDNIETVIVNGFRFNEDIYSDLARLKNLKHLEFINTDLENTRQALPHLKKISKLEKLLFRNTKLSQFPYAIFELPKLKELSLTRNNFFDQNFLFAFDLKKAELDKKRNEIEEKICNLAEQENFEDRLIRYKWGLSNAEKTVVILIDPDREIDINEDFRKLCVFVIKETDRYQTFQRYSHFFEKFQQETNFLATEPDDNTLKTFFYFQNSILIKFSELKRFQKENKLKHGQYFVSDLITYLGGEQLVHDIVNQQIEEDHQLSKEFYNKNHYIQHIIIENFKLFEKAELTGLDDVNVFVGKNGSGKTSLLQAIAIGLLPEGMPGIESPQKYMNKKTDNKPNNLRYIRTQIAWKNFKKANRIFLGSSLLENSIFRILHERELPQEKSPTTQIPQSYLILAYGENLFAQKNPFASENQNYQDILANGFYNPVHVSPIFNVSYPFMTNPLELLLDLSQERLRQKHKAQAEELEEIARIIQNKLNVFLKRSTAQALQIQRDGSSFYFLDTERKLYLDLDQISEGYRSYIILIADIVFRILAARKKLLVNGFELKQIFKNVKGAIIIDEFDKHIHPAWQKTFLKNLREEFPKIQFFLSTHNIASLQSAEGEKIFVLTQSNGEIHIQNEKIPEGLSIEALYGRYFDEHFFSHEITQRLSSFKKRRREMMRNKKFDELDNPNSDFMKQAGELRKISSQTSLIVDIELQQLFKQKENAKAK